MGKELLICSETHRDFFSSKRSLADPELLIFTIIDGNSSHYIGLRRFLIRGPFENFVVWWQCAAVRQRKAVTVIPSCSGGGNVVVA
jgi:hypothetical protein